MANNEYDFQKKFSNIGIDKESILAIHKDEKEQPRQQPAVQGQKPMEPGSDAQEIMLLKRKIDYITNSMFAKIDERFAELDKKIEEKTGTVVEYNRELTLLRNDITELKRKMSNIHVSFDDDYSAPSKPASKSSGMVTSAPIPKDEEDSSRPNPAPQRPGAGKNPNVKVEDYFNFSNKKF